MDEKPKRRPRCKWLGRDEDGRPYCEHGPAVQKGNWGCRESNNEAQRRYRQSEKGREKRRLHREEYRERANEAKRRSRQSEEVIEREREANRRYRQTEKGREKQREAQRRYWQTEKGKETKRRYRQSEKGREKRRENQRRDAERRIRIGGALFTIGFTEKERKELLRRDS